MATLIKNGRIVTAESDYPADILIEDGKVKAIGQDLAAGETRQVTFTYPATDSHGLVSDPATVTRVACSISLADRSPRRPESHVGETRRLASNLAPIDCSAPRGRTTSSAAAAPKAPSVRKLPSGGSRRQVGLEADDLFGTMLMIFFTGLRTLALRSSNVVCTTSRSRHVRALW